MNVAKIISDNTCVHCGNVVNENLRKWFKDKWVNIGKKKKGGGHPPCGTSGKKRGYAKCVPKSKAANMTKKQKASATRRKRAAQNKAGRGGTSSTRGGGKKPINVKTKAESKMNLESYVGKMMTEAQFDEAAGEKDACYHKVKARYDVWPSAYASGALVKCRKVGAKNWGNKSKKEGVNERTRMKPQVKKLLKQKGYNPIFGAIDNSKRQLKQMRYSRGEIQDTLISMFGDEDPKILQKIKESVNEVEIKKSKLRLLKVNTKYTADEVMDLYKELNNRDVDSELVIQYLDTIKDRVKMMRKNVGLKESVNEKKGDFLDSLFPKSKVDKAVKIAHDMGGNMTGAVKKIEKYFKGMTLHSKVRDALQQANESVNENNMGDKLWEACWKGYEKKGMKKMFGKMYPNCVKKTKKEGIQTTTWLGENEMYWENNLGEYGGFTFEVDEDLNEAEYQGRKVKLGKIMQGDTKKFKVYVKNPKGNVVKVNFGQGGGAKGGTMRIRKDNPKARKSFRARHNCDNPGPRHKARYWSCRKW